MILQGNCLDKLKELPDNSVDSIVTDPPYELGFMGKHWDNTGIANNVEMWKECLRVLKPGAYLLSFGGTRTYHRMASAIEDAGFEIRDMMCWAYGQGFPKSLNVRLNMDKSVDKFINSKTIDLIWENQKIRNVCCVDKHLQKDILNQEISLMEESIAQENVVEEQIKTPEQKNALIVEKKLQDQSPYSIKELFVIENAEQNLLQQEPNVKSVEKILLKEKAKLKNQNIITVECNVKELLRESLMDKIKEEEVQKIWLGKWLYSNEMDLNAKFVELIENLKLTILKELKNIPNLDMKFQMESLTATNVIITKSTMECLILNMADILKELIKNNFDGIGSALKPSIEPICFSRKPLEKGLSIAENCLKYGTGGINIDESRVEAQGQDLDKLNSEWDREWNTNYTDYAEKVGGNAGFNMDKAKKENAGLTGRFPANLIHDGSEEVLKEFEKAGISKSNNGRINKIGTPTDSPVSFGVANKEHEYSDEGTPARFFKQCEFTEEDFEYAPFFYCTKASKSERNMGCEELEEKRGGCMEANVTDKMQLGGASLKGEPKEIKPTKNNHPTVKPLKLMEYLIKMVTPKGGIVLDPFAGSGTTLVASKKLGYKYIGIELTPEYIPIIEARLNSIQQGVLF